MILEAWSNWILLRSLLKVYIPWVQTPGIIKFFSVMGLGNLHLSKFSIFLIFILPLLLYFFIIIPTLCQFPCHNHRTIVHVRESFLLFAQSLHLLRSSHPELSAYFWIARKTNLKRIQSLMLLKQRKKRPLLDIHTRSTSNLLFKGNKLLL